MDQRPTEKLLPDQLKELWAPDSDARHKRSPEDSWQEQQRLIATYTVIWADALRLETHPDLKESLLSEIGEYTGCDRLDEIERRCRGAVEAVKEEWHRKETEAGDRTSVEAFYDRTEAYVFDLMWWHALVDDPSPLAYVVAMQFAEQLLEKAHVAVVPGEAFGTDEHVRISYATSMEELTRGLDRLHKFIAG